MKRWLYRKAKQYLLNQHKLWRKTGGHEGIKLSFAGEQIRGADFNRAELQESNFFKADMSHCLFHQVNFRQANFNEASMHHAIFEKTDLFKADLTTANLRGARHQIHVVNRQKMDLESILKQAEKFWLLADKLTGEDRHNLMSFLTNNRVRRPNETVHVDRSGDDGTESRTL